MKKTIKFTVTFLLLSIFISSCKTENYKVTYVNLAEVYKTNSALIEADSIHQQQVLRIQNYVAVVNQQLSEQQLSEIKMAELNKAYNDTISSFKQQIDRVYNDVKQTQNNHIQKIIDSIAKSRNYNYVLSTVNNNILYVKDSTNNITDEVIELVKKQ